VADAGTPPAAPAAPAVADVPAARAAPRIAVVGVSVNRFCGVRDHARLLAEELERRGASCSFHWLTRERAGLRAARAEVRAWARELGGALSAERPDVVLLHYSVFSYCFRGLPLLLRPVLRAVARADAPVLVFGHELAFPWTYGGWRGKVWALAQRPAVLALVRACAGLLVTADFRAEWLRSRRWLPRRPLLVAPVFPTIPLPRAQAGAGHERELLGLFGYGYGGVPIAAVLDALGILRERRVGVRLRLLGTPGADSPAGQAWIAAARARGLEQALSFSGTVPPQELSDALAACAVLLFADGVGPSSRKTTLAGSLATGRPVIATDGRRSWALLARSDAIRVVPPAAGPLAEAVGALLSDPAQADALGARGRAFAQREMSVAHSAELVESLLATVGAASSGCR
jgi:glycosyltransferase involved in cell wall biosynthesis